VAAKPWTCGRLLSSFRTLPYEHLIRSGNP
jgi:hypothetical protein